MKRLLTIFLFTLLVHAAKAVDITQFYAGGKTFTTNIVVWTVRDEADVDSYVIERNGIEIYEQFSGHYLLSAGYYCLDDSGSRLWNLYTLRVVFNDGHSEIRGAAYVFPVWWKWW